MAILNMDLGIKALIIVSAFLIIQILVFWKNHIRKTEYRIYWFCDFVPMLFAIGFLFDAQQFIKSLINIGFMSQLFTGILLIYGFSTGVDIIGTRKTESYGRFYMIIELLIHLVPATVALILTYKIMPAGVSLIYSLIILTLMFFLTIIFTKPKDNTNLIWYLTSSDSGLKIFKLPYQNYLWILYSFIIVVIPNFLIQYCLVRCI
jgi:hypothetical protein